MLQDVYEAPARSEGATTAGDGRPPKRDASRGRMAALAVGAVCIYGIYEAIDAGVRLSIGRPARFGAFNGQSWGWTHYIPGLLFAVVMPLQLWSRFRNRYRRLHRILGRVALVCGGVLGVTALASLLDKPPAWQVFTAVLTLLFFFCGTRAFVTARRRQIAEHRRWAVRTFALGMVPITERVAFAVFAMTFGISGARSFWNLMSVASWLTLALHLGLAQLVLARRSASSAATVLPSPTARPS